MDSQLFVALLQNTLLLGSKDSHSKEETLAYNHFLDYAGSIARYNRQLVEEAYRDKLDEELPHESQRARPAAGIT